MCHLLVRNCPPAPTDSCTLCPKRSRMLPTPYLIIVGRSSDMPHAITLTCATEHNSVGCNKSDGRKRIAEERIALASSRPNERHIFRKPHRPEHLRTKDSGIADLFDNKGRESAREEMRTNESCNIED